MKSINIISAVVFIFCTTAELSQISAQTSAVNGSTQNINNELRKTVKSILHHYNKLLNSDDARAIVNSFLSAGLQRGSDLNAAIQQEGFDPELIYKLAEKQ